MWIKCRNEATRSLYNHELMDKPVSFNDNGTAQVKKEVGEKLVDEYSVIVPHRVEDSKSGSDDGSDDDAVSDDE